MTGWLALMLIVAIAGRETTRELNVFQIMEARSVLGFFMLYPLIRLNGGFEAMKTSRPLQHVARNLIHYAAQLGWFFALTLIPLGQVVAIEFTMPIWTAILAASFLGERMTIWKISAIVLGVVGVVVIVRPATGEINPGQLIALGAAVGFGISVAMMKSPDPHRNDAGDHFLDAGNPVRGRIFPLSVRLEMAFRVCLGLAGRDRVLRDIFPLLHGARDAVRRCHRGAADGFPAGSVSRRGRLADLLGTAGHVHAAWCGADPYRQSFEPQGSRSGFLARRSLTGTPGRLAVGFVCGR
jgi:uncharacterized membrane protein